MVSAVRRFVDRRVRTPVNVDHVPQRHLAEPVLDYLQSLSNLFAHQVSILFSRYIPQWRVSGVCEEHYGVFDYKANG